MTTIQLVQHVWRRWLALGLLVVVMGCAMGPKLVSHSFNYDGFNDKWADKVDLLAYSYGDEYHKLEDKAAAGSTLGAQGNVNGPIPVGEFLYVRWRVKATGEVLEQRVDLRDRLPRDMTEHGLTFLMDGKQLYVYVTTPAAQQPWGKTATHRTWHSKYNVTYEIFPTIEKAGGK